LPLAANPTYKSEGLRRFGLIVRIIHIGIKKDEIISPVEPEIVATILISTIEGAIMMSKLDGDPIHLQRVVSYLQQYLQDTLGKSA
jgi:TetR/AcrR family transcriptional regulator, transcriptional repressor for nem operon